MRQRGLCSPRLQEALLVDGLGAHRVEEGILVGDRRETKALHSEVPPTTTARHGHNGHSSGVVELTVILQLAAIPELYWARV